jgi:HptB-dependent secretion and biofilm anti anti-sigma factor
MNINEKINCWEYHDCGRIPGGHREDELGVCPSFNSKHTDGENSGINGGRLCWSINNTFCRGKVQGKTEDKISNCLNCDFYKLVRRDEGSRFILVNTKKKTRFNEKLINIDIGRVFTYETVSKIEENFIKTIIENRSISVELDFKKTIFIDSSALGLLLVFKKYLNGKSGEIEIINASEYVKGVLRTANFDRLFKVV